MLVRKENYKGMDIHIHVNDDEEYLYHFTHNGVSYASRYEYTDADEAFEDGKLEVEEVLSKSA